MLTVQEITKKLMPIFIKNDVKKAILFGSYAKGLADENSDVDICVDSHLRGLKFMILVDDIYQVLLKKIDMFPFYSVHANSSIDTHIKNSGVVIYEKQSIS